jgi:hypothetical protein
MKFWELTSTFRTEPHILDAVLSYPQWLPFQTAYAQFSALVVTQDRTILDAEVPKALVHAVAMQSQLRFRYYPEMKLLRLVESDFFPGQVSQELNVLEVYDRFGGSCMEEVLEKGSCAVTPKANEQAG